MLPTWRESEAQTWQPPESLTPCEWAEAKRVLTAPSEERGPLRLDRTPYLRPMMEMADRVDVDEIWFMKSAQVAGTECLLSILGYAACQWACSVMYIMADENTAKYAIRKRIQPIFCAPALRHLIVPETFGLSEISLANDAHIMMAWAASVGMLAARPCRVVLGDEVDKPGWNVATSEAAPISLARERTASYNNRLCVWASTPTLDTGNITQGMESCDVLFDWQVPCPRCGVFQPLRWSREYTWGFADGKYRDPDGVMREFGQVTWDGGRHADAEQIESAGYECGTCGEVWTNAEKSDAVTRGVSAPRSDSPETPRRVGFHINRLYSLLGKSGDIAEMVRDFIGCLGDPGRLQGFVNSSLAEPWEQVLVRSTEHDILRARTDVPAQTVPDGTVALTCGVDVQRYGFPFAVRAWAKDYRSWLIHYGVAADWEELKTLLFETAYPIDRGGTMRIARAAIDTGGGATDEGPTMTEQTYEFLRRYGRGRGCRVYGTKGSSSAFGHGGKAKLGNVIERTPANKPMPGGFRLVLLDTDALKDMFFYRISQAVEENGHHAAFLHSGVGMDYVRQILAEEKRADPKTGRVTWTQIARDNHYLDTECLAHACAEPDWPGGGVNLVRCPVMVDVQPSSPDRPQTTGRTPAPAKPKHSGWLTE